MAKDPAFLFYTGDFSTGTQFLSDEQVGKYLRLLMAQHQHGRLTEKHMMMICKSYDNDVFSKFIRDEEGLYYNTRLELEINKRKTYSESRSKNKKGKLKDTSSNNTSLSYDNHMENENKDVNIQLDNTSNNHENFKENCLSDEVWVNTISVREKIALESMPYALKDFNEHLISYGTIKPDLSDYKYHFVSWVKKRRQIKADTIAKESKLKQDRL